VNKTLLNMFRAL